MVSPRERCPLSIFDAEIVDNLVALE